MRMILLISVSIILFLMLFLKSNNRKTYGCMVLLLWIIFALSSETADYNIYVRRFNYPEMENTEPGFNALVYLCKFMGMDLRGLIIIIAFIYISALTYTIFKNCKNSGYVLCLYFIYPFCMDVAQMRNALSFAPILFGYKYLLEDKKYNDIKYLGCVALATSIHYSGLFYLLLLLCKKISIKKTLIITSITSIVFFLPVDFKPLILNIATKLGVGTKAKAVLYNLYMQQHNTIVGTQKMMIFNFVLLAIIFWVIYRYIDKNILQDKMVNLVVKMDIMMLILVPLLVYAVDLFRVGRYIQIFNYMAFANIIYNYSKNKSKQLKKTLIFKIAFTVVPIYGLYVNVIQSNIFDYVIKPLFESNILVK